MEAGERRQLTGAGDTSPRPPAYGPAVRTMAQAHYGKELSVRSYRTEFPDYDPATLPEIPADWQDHSWHNDACPSWRAKGDDASGLYVFVDYATPSQREMADGNAPRFSVMHYADNGAERGEVFASDEWADVLRVAREWEAGKHCTLNQWAASGEDCADIGAALDDEGLAGKAGRLYGYGCLYILR